MRGTGMRRAWRFGAIVLAAAMLWAVPALPARAAIPVTNTDDGGSGSLRDAISRAMDGDTIDMMSLHGTINLSGQLVVDKALTIIGPGADVLNVSGFLMTRVFLVQQPQRTAPISVFFQGFKIELGFLGEEYGCGGGLLAQGVQVSGMNVAPHITMNKMVVERNSALHGGGICGSDIVLQNTIVSRNTAMDDASRHCGEGGGIYATIVTLTNSLVERNAACQGGGLYSNVIIVGRTTFSNNTATLNGGAIRGCSFSRVSTPTPSFILNSTFSGNTVGGQVPSDVPSGVSRSGGAILGYRCDLTVLNSTLVNNGPSGSTEVDGGNISMVDNPLPPAVVVSHLSMGNTILAGSTSAASADLRIHDGTTVTNRGSNLVNRSPDFAFTAPGDLFGMIDPQLAPLNASYLGSNGFLPVHFPRSFSPVIDAGDDAICTRTGLVGSMDQRGIARPQLGHCDIGAVESQGFRPYAVGIVGQTTGVNSPFTTPVRVYVLSNDFGETRPSEAAPVVVGTLITFQVNPVFETGTYLAAFEGGAHSVTTFADEMGRAMMPRLIAGPMPGTLIVNMRVPHMNDGGPNLTFTIVAPGVAPTSRPMGMSPMGTPTPLPGTRPAAPTVAPTPAPAPTRRP